MRTALYLALGLALAPACSGSAPARQSPELPARSTSAEAAPTPAPTSDVDARRKALDALLAEHWQYGLERSPEFASIIGDKRYNDRWSDMSLEAIAADLVKTKEFLARFEAIDTTGFPDQDALNRRLMVRDLKHELDTARFEDWLMPIDQQQGVHILLPQVVSLLSFETVKDYEDYIKRLDAIPTVMAQATALARAGLAKGLMPPRGQLERTIPQAENLAKTAAKDLPFAQPVAKFPDGIPAADQQRLRAAVLKSVETKVLPAYVAFAAFLKTEYAPKGRTEVGVWALPDGDGRYAASVKFFTTTEMTPDEIHDIGVREVARIETEATAIAKRLGFKSLKAFQDKVRKDKKLYATSRQDILDRYQRHTDEMYVELPKLFGRLPKARMEIKPVEEFREKEASGAQYMPAPPDGSRPGIVRVNTGDATQRQVTSIETTAYHEGVPGHHLQSTIQREIEGLAPFRQQAYFGAYIEGWGLYAERLGRELGFYKDAYSEYGHLQAEMLRAIRLVVDTGLHAKKWKREQVVKYFHDHSTVDEPTVQNETDRYIVNPGQALSYKVGQLTILRLRTKAQEALGGTFDIRAFHDEILGGGALPLDVLEERVDAWIARQKA
jgi:uncharacterized protein (DUF885 family)